MDVCTGMYICVYRDVWMCVQGCMMRLQGCMDVFTGLSHNFGNTVCGYNSSIKIGY